MSFAPVVLQEADVDPAQAHQCYNEKEEGLGNEFTKAVTAAIGSLAETALLHPIRDQSLQLRWAFPRRFPYRIIFRVIDSTVVVHAVWHASREDRKLQGRFRER